MDVAKRQVTSDELDQLRAAYSRKQLAVVEAGAAEADWNLRITTTMVAHSKNADLDVVSLCCGVITRSGTCDCKAE